LIELAKRDGGAIMTNDFNLNKVASAEGVRVLNINDLALTLRTEYLPGEKARVKVTSKGNGRKQGVGYMPDGTMVVIEEAGGRVGSEIEVEIIRSLQTAAGKMLFARVGGRGKGASSSGSGAEASEASGTGRVGGTGGAKGQRPRSFVGRNNRPRRES
jgi:hypothetical protein